MSRAANRLPMKLAALLLALTFAPCAAAAAQGARAETAARAKGVKPSDVFRAADADRPEAPTAFDFELGGFAYRVAANGNGRRTKGDKTRRFNLRLGGGEDLRRLLFADYDGDLLLLCEVGGREEPRVVVTRLEQPSMRALWQRGVPSASIEAMRQGGALYLAGAGLVARLDLKTGEYDWLHRDRAEEEEGEEGDEESGEVGDRGRARLIPPGRYGEPEVSGETVTFRARADAENPRPRTVRVNRKTGKIISID